MLTSVKRVAAALAAGTLLALPAPARADGDPAGDVLASRSVFYGSALDLRSREAAQLPALLARARESGYEVRVAALSVSQDLGAVDYLWDDPLNYAPFLASELVYVYRGRVLVVMPSGYAVAWPGHSTARENRLLAKLAPPDGDPSAVIPGAMAAVIRLARAHGIRLTIPDVEPAPGGVRQPLSHYQQAAGGVRGARPAVTDGTSGAAWLFLLPVAVLAGTAAALIARNRLRERSVAR